MKRFWMDAPLYALLAPLACGGFLLADDAPRPKPQQSSVEELTLDEDGKPTKAEDGKSDDGKPMKSEVPKPHKPGDDSEPSSSEDVEELSTNEQRPEKSRSTDPGQDPKSVKAKVKQELDFDAGVAASGIQVETRDGVVTLTGEVNNLLAKSRAARVAESVRGVKSVVNELTVKLESERDDAEIKEAIQSNFKDFAATREYRIDAEVEDGVVTLTGKVDSYNQKSLAGIVVKGIRGVSDLRNNISIDYTDARTDDDIRTDVESALSWSVFVEDDDVSVLVSDGEVTLLGTVDSATERSIAKRLAWVDGVANVDVAKLVVVDAAEETNKPKPIANRSVREMRASLERALEIDPRVNVENVSLDLDGSVVTLTGTVSDLSARRAAAQTARNTAGVSLVTNRLEVSAPDNAVESDTDDAASTTDEPQQTSPRPDEKTQLSLRNAIENNVTLTEDEIAATVEDGVAKLRGNVDTQYEKSQAEDLASRVYGVIDVDNNIQVSRSDAYIYDPAVDNEYYDDYSSERGYYTDDDFDVYETDAEIEDDINDEMWWSPFVDSDEVNVSVDEAVATLSGTVDSWAERESAIENAYEGGARRVIDKMDVR